MSITAITVKPNRPALRPGIYERIEPGRLAKCAERRSW
jgi:hypothetical protein